MRNICFNCVGNFFFLNKCINYEFFIVFLEFGLIYIFGGGGIVWFICIICFCYFGKVLDLNINSKKILI